MNRLAYRTEMAKVQNINRQADAFDKARYTQTPHHLDLSPPLPPLSLSPKSIVLLAGRAGKARDAADKTGKFAVKKNYGLHASDEESSPEFV